ncbi:TonB-dependent receptor [Gaetbulibacter aquiaggeris]|uniref:TonB-dependent receptor n=1 Tax=Gaetbulibacter aquiaggeris TaxID=1735373 RepID=A0ABW7MQA4_9FLAO
MKTFIFLIVTTFFGFTSEYSFSQEKVIIEKDQLASVNQVFKIIKKQTQFNFVYPKDAFLNMPKVQLKKGEITVIKLLEQTFENDNINFEFSKDNTIFIKRNPIIKVNPSDEEKQQQYQINGTIKDESGQPLPGANIIEKGTTNGTQSDFDGEFSITLKNQNAILVVSYIGYETIEINTNSQTNINIVLKEDASLLDEVVVVGYGTQKRVTLTGAVSAIKTEEIQESKTANLANNLTGRVAGLVINSRGGEPGSDSVDILIRGKGTTGDNTPLYVIDGIANRGSFERLNPDDIESISILKDASAAIYGAQAANGVILVTTKRGKNGKTVFSFNHNYSLAQATRRPYLMNAQQYLTWVDEQNSRNGRPTEFQSVIRQYRDGSVDKSVWGDTDWWDEVVDNWTPQSQYAASIRGGGEKTQFYLSGQLLDQDALYKGDAYGYKQYNIRSNIDTQLSNNFRLGFDLAARIGDKNSPTLDTDALIRQVFVQRPYEFPYFENGLVAKTSAGNPVNLVNGNSGSKETNTKKFDSKFSFTWDLPFITEGLYASGYAAIDFYTTTRKDLSKPFDQYEYDEATGTYNNLKFQTGRINLFQQYSEELNKTFHFKFGYNKTFDKHAISSFIAYEQYEQKGEYIAASRQDLISENIPFLFSGSDENIQNDGKGYQSARRNYFGKFNYAFDDKYLLDITLRYDGSANFAKDNRYGFFPAASLGWRISEEDFFKSDLVTELKLRGSWGLLGNDKVPNFQYLQFYDIDNSYIFGETTIRTNGLTPGTTANPNITWETAEKINLGIDFRLKRNLLAGSIDAFYENRSDILAPRNASIPIFSGLTLPDENIGKVSNKGIELQLNHRNTINEVSYSLGGQFTYARSKIKFIDESPNIPEWQRRTGNPVDYLIVYQADGIYQNQDEIDNSAHFSDAKPGDVKFTDKNGDGFITEDDQIILDKSPTPRVVYGITMGLEWKNFALNVLFQGQAGAQTIYRPFDLNQQAYFYENRWVSENFTPNASYPAAYDLGSSSYQNVSTIWVKNNSFLRLKNVELSYSLSQDLLKSIGLESFRIFITGNNLFLIYDNAKINDPESNSSTGWFYPQQRLISTGINLTF